MTRRVERQSWLAGATLALVVGSGPGLVDARAQLVMEQTFVMETETCVGVSCRKQIIGANETFGVGADGACTKGNHYGYPLEGKATVASAAMVYERDPLLGCPCL